MECSSPQPQLPIQRFHAKISCLSFWLCLLLDAWGLLPAPSLYCSHCRQGQRLGLDELSLDNCRVFVDRDGEVIRVMCCDYGFRAGAGRMYQDNYGEVPENVFVMVRSKMQPLTVAAFAALPAAVFACSAAQQLQAHQIINKETPVAAPGAAADLSIAMLTDWAAFTCKGHICCSHWLPFDMPLRQCRHAALAGPFYLAGPAYVPLWGFYLTLPSRCVLCPQAATNFQHELAALRRSFRYDEYEVMEAPPNFFAKVGQVFPSCHMAVCQVNCLFCSLNPALPEVLNGSRSFEASTSWLTSRLTGHWVADCWCCWACNSAWVVCC